MKCFALVFLLLGVFAASSFAAVSTGKYNDARHPGKCTINDQLILSPGEEAKDPNQDCGRIICRQQGYAQFHTCGTMHVEGATLGDYVDKSLPYPDCCKRTIIPN